MSAWTHVIGAIHINYKHAFDLDNDEKFKKELEKMFSKAPKIRGSEGDADIFVSIDPSVCTYGPAIVDTCSECPKFVNEECIDELDYKCNKVCFRHRAIITINGDLRDCSMETTEKEVIAFLKWVRKHASKYLPIRNYSVSIYDGIQTKPIIIPNYMG